MNIMPDEKDDIILGADGQPLTGKALKKARRAAQVANRSGAAQVSSTQNATTKEKSIEIEKNVVKSTTEEPKLEEIKKEPEQQAESPQTVSEPVFLNPKTGEPLIGKALKKARREAAVKQRDAGSGEINQKVQIPVNSGSDAPKVLENTVRSKIIGFISKVSKKFQSVDTNFQNSQSTRNKHQTAF